MTFPAIGQTKLVPSQCEMLGMLYGEMVSREIKQERYEIYLQELFPRFDAFPEELKSLLLTFPRVIKLDRSKFPDTANEPEAHQNALTAFCYGNRGDVKLMQDGLDEFLKQNG